MEALVQDLNSALEESTASSSHKRKSWKRRKKKNEASFDSDSDSSVASSSSSGKKQPLLRRSRRRLEHREHSGCESAFPELSKGGPRPKRKRKCKRPPTQLLLLPEYAPVEQSQKRKKLRTISAESKFVRPGKRPRSTSSPMDEDDSSSSGEEDEDEEEPFEDPEYDDRGGEADDEQSDWPGANEDEENSREIRSGTRKNAKEDVSLHQQMNSFVRDASRMDLKLNARLSSERNKIVQFANLYSLSLKAEGAQRLRLTKTCNTLGNPSGGAIKDEGLFLIPGLPSAASSSSLEFKRRRKTPPIPFRPSPLNDDAQSPPRDSAGHSPASKRRTNYYEGSRSS